MNTNHEWTLKLPEDRSLILGGTAKLMGILNITPDSFYEHSRTLNETDLLRRDDSMLTCAVKTGLPYVLSHIYGTPATMRDIPDPEDIMSDLHTYFQTKLQILEEAGMYKERIIIDPGLGFGKGMKSNLRILNEVESLHVFGCPVLIGHSRKRFTGAVIGSKESEARLHSTTAISALIEGKVEIIRVHDVAANYQAMITVRSLRNI